MAGSAEPKRRNYAKTRARILTAAYEAFAEHGYAKAGIREIAARADVASSLVIRYFGTKAALFEEALTNAIYANSLFVRDKARFGDTMAKLVASEADVNLTAMTVLAIADPASRDVVLKVVERHIVTPLAEWLGPPDARSRALAMLSLLTGFTIQVRQLSTDPIAPETVKWLGRALQDIVDEV